MTTGPGETTTTLCTTTPNRGRWPGKRDNSLFISAYPVELITSTWRALSDNLKPCLIGLVVSFSSLSFGCYNFPFLVPKEPLFNSVWRLICSWNGPTFNAGPDHHDGSFCTRHHRTDCEDWARGIQAFCWELLLGELLFVVFLKLLFRKWHEISISEKEMSSGRIWPCRWESRDFSDSFLISVYLAVSDRTPAWLYWLHPSFLLVAA